MKSNKTSIAIVFLFSITFLASAYRRADAHTTAGPVGIHFKIAGKQYDVPVVRGLYDQKSGTFAIYNAFLPGFPETTITLSIGSNFKAGTGTFKSAANEKGSIFYLSLGNLKDITAYAGGKDAPDGAFTWASTPVTITITSFSSSGSDRIKGNISAQGTFSGTVYDFRNKKNVALTDGTFSVGPVN